MRLAEFIRANTLVIADEWERFAGTLLPDEEFKTSVLRNSIEEILEITADDMDELQSDEQQIRKSKGETPSKAIEDISEQHVLQRIKMGLACAITLQEQSIRA